MSAIPQTLGAWGPVLPEDRGSGDHVQSWVVRDTDTSRAEEGFTVMTFDSKCSKAGRSHSARCWQTDLFQTGTPRGLGRPWTSSTPSRAGQGSLCAQLGWGRALPRAFWGSRQQLGNDMGVRVVGAGELKERIFIFTFSIIHNPKGKIEILVSDILSPNTRMSELAEGPFAGVSCVFEGPPLTPEPSNEQPY